VIEGCFEKYLTGHNMMQSYSW